MTRERDFHVRRWQWLSKEHQAQSQNQRSTLVQRAWLAREIDYELLQIKIIDDKISEWERLKREEADFLAQHTPQLEVIQGEKKEDGNQ